jgi:tetratricopeptide (TPR) repeat protein
MQFEEAISNYQKALFLMPDNSLIHYNLGLTFQMCGQLKRAQEFYLRSIAIEPGSADAYNNLGKLYHDRNLLAQAIEAYDEAIQIDAGHSDAHFNRALSLLACARFEEGWSEYEWRFRRDAWQKIYPHRLAGPRWDGSDFAGRTLLVHSEQGFGDTIQFVRYLPRVKALGGTVVLEARRELWELLQGVAGIDKLLAMSFEHPPTQDYDMQVPLMSLPGLFGTTPASIPGPVPYLHATPDKRKQWQRRISGSELKIGLTWAAKTTYMHEKSCALDCFFPLTELQGVRIYGLQKGSASENLPNMPPGLINLGAGFETFADTAGAIDCLDLVISVDTAVAHLAGAMGKPVWLLLPFAADWRWLLERRDSPWYPTMRLFRQQHPRGWENVVNQVVTELGQWIETGTL